MFVALRGSSRDLAIPSVKNLSFRSQSLHALSMPSLLRRSLPAPAVTGPRSLAPLNGWKPGASDGAPPHRRAPWQVIPQRMRMMGRVALALVLGLGAMGQGASATERAIGRATIAHGETSYIQAISLPAPPSALWQRPPSLESPLAQSNFPVQQPGSAEEEALQGSSEARIPASKGSIYKPIRLQSGQNVEDTLTTRDIPLGQGSFARDYVINLKAQDQIAIDLFSDSFDTVVTLMAENGTTLGENDDGPDGGTNSLLFMRIEEDGEYVVRVRGFGQAKGGPFTLKLTRLKPAK